MAYAFSGNVYRPDDGKKCPVILSVTPYGKDRLPDRVGMLFMRLAGVNFGTLNVLPLDRL